ncbi:Calvin cycle protein CP12 [Mastigocoleus sp. MO_188.B34]|uniref:Calvin cycle protein CP12 n=1 Tax=Mastigocoleus sp. MO_188.B34 TaxID=3036635 RepID=UPI0026079690|nr:Calvin cycle protein CP12 [Mastigocoleus sp. MO_188.B34]MDJ0692984.1 Calvin cycle protein CP12 [Mastigocoleus sp. MO_188.B34]
MANNMETVTNPMLTEEIQKAIVEARSTCQDKGDGSSECAVAWDIVEELQAEKSHQKQAAQRKNSLEVYCENHPEAIECLVYDV